MTPLFISLTKGEVMLVSPEDYHALVEIGRWCFSKSAYAVHYYQDEDGRNKTLYAHRVVMALMLGHAIPPGMQVDHISGAELGAEARLDNRRENLRLATRSQNQAHKGIPCNNTSSYKGVTRNTGKWEARIKYGDKRLNLGRFDKPEEAALMYDAATRLLNAAFAGPNFSEHPRRAIFEQVLAVLNEYGLDTTTLYRSDAFYRSR
jgi:hypothetical protein